MKINFSNNISIINKNAFPKKHTSNPTNFGKAEEEFPKTPDAKGCGLLPNGYYPPLNKATVEQSQIITKTKETKPDYSDLEKFSLHLEKKIKTMLGEESPEDISATVKEISEITDTDEKIVRETMSALTEFAGWSQLGALEKELSDCKAGEPYDVFDGSKADSFKKSTTQKLGYLTLNDVFFYLSNRKRQMLFKTTEEKTLFTDDFQTEEIKQLKEKMPLEFKRLQNDIKTNKVKPVIINGWNAKVNGKDVSQTMFGSACSLKESCISVINEMKASGKTLDEVLNAESVKEFRSVLELDDDVPIHIIRNNQLTGTDNESISRRISTNHPSNRYIRTVSEILTNAVSKSEGDKEKNLVLLNKYFDEMLTCFGSKALSEDMRKKYKQINAILKSKNKSPDDAIYIVPAKGKSFELITYQYAKTNGISPDKIYYFNGLTPTVNRFNEEFPSMDGKTIVLLDDMAGSGSSMTGAIFKYHFFSNSKAGSADVIFAPVIALEHGCDKIKLKKAEVRREDKDILLPGKVINENKFFEENNMTKTCKKIEFERLLGGFGYNRGTCCSAFPYMIPDNNTSAAGLLLAPFLKQNNSYSNKNRDLLIIHGDEVNKKVLESS